MSGGHRSVFNAATTIGFCLILLAINSVAAPTEFFLKSEKTGKTYGPFTTENGSRVSLGKGKFVVISKKVKPSGTEEILGSIELDQFHVLQASIDDAVDALTKNIRAHRSGIPNLSINVKPRSVGPNLRKDRPNPATDLSREPRITLELTNVTALEALRKVAEAYDYRLEIAIDRVTLFPKSP